MPLQSDYAQSERTLRPQAGKPPACFTVLTVSPKSIPADPVGWMFEEVIVSAAIAIETLTAADRCDRCGARAYIRVSLPSGGELLFCAHHGHAHQPALEAADARVHDESDLLVETPPSAPDGEH